MADMVVLVPTRGRPDNARRLIQACEKTCRADTRIILGVDDDDAWQYRPADTTGAIVITRPRMGLAKWTNELATVALHDFADYGTALASLGDDHVPESDGWDVSLIEALGAMGGGWAYPWDGRRDDIAEAVAVSAPIVAALGWMALPGLHHWCIDNAWTALARYLGRLAYLDHVKVPHVHPHNPDPQYQAPADPVYEEARWSYDLDKRRYLAWRDQGGMAADAHNVREILGDGGTMTNQEGPICGAKWPNLGPAGELWTCTLDLGHDGDHEALIGPGKRANDPSATISQGDEAIISD